jgi:hypothetical protein
MFRVISISTLYLKDLSFKMVFYFEEIFQLFSEYQGRPFL